MQGGGGGLGAWVGGPLLIGGPKAIGSVHKSSGELPVLPHIGILVSGLLPV